MEGEEERGGYGGKPKGVPHYIFGGRLSKDCSIMKMVIWSFVIGGGRMPIRGSPALRPPLIPSSISEIGVPGSLTSFWGYE
jgi:hypothetical protein